MFVIHVSIIPFLATDTHGNRTMCFRVRKQLKHRNYLLLSLLRNCFFFVISDRFWYCRLSPNLKFLHYGDCEEGHAPSLENLPNKCEYSGLALCGWAIISCGAVIIL